MTHRSERVVLGRSDPTSCTAPLLLLLAGIATEGLDRFALGMGDPLPILFDTDIASDVDDVLALALALASPDELRIVAITTVSGDTALRARAAAELLAVAGARGIEICLGESAPLLRSARRFARIVDEDRIRALPAAPYSAESAPERILRAARETPGLELVFIGPLTNLARALALEPDLPNQISGVTIMGGHIGGVYLGDYECPHGVDYNLCSDPEASMAVLGAGFRTTLVPADVTLRTWMTTADLERLEASGPVARLLARQIRVWSPVQRSIFTGMGGQVDADNVAFLHDPLTLQALIDPAPIHFEALRIVPTIQGGVFRTVSFPVDSEHGAKMTVATRVDPRAAAEGILERLCAH